MIDPDKPDYESPPASAGRAGFCYLPREILEPPLVSIVTPVWNSGDCLEETKACVLQQSLQQFEWIVIDDGSDDAGTLSRIRELEREDARVRVIGLGENRGPSAARNAGLDKLRSDFVLFLDSDNLIEPTAAEKLYWFLRSFPRYSFATGFSVGFGARRYLWERGFHSRQAFLRANQVDLTCCLVRRDVLRAVGGFDETIRDGFEDWDLWLRCAGNGFWGATIPEFLAWYRRRPDHSDRWPDWDGASRQAAFLAQLRRRYPSLWTAGLPPVETTPDAAARAELRDAPPANPLTKSSPRCLLVLPSLDNGRVARLASDAVRSIRESSLEVTIVVHHRADRAALARLTRSTPDVFVLSHFLSSECCPVFLRYLVESRQIDVVVNLGCDALRDLLRARDPAAARLPEPPVLDAGLAGATARQRAGRGSTAEPHDLGRIVKELVEGRRTPATGSIDPREPAEDRAAAPADVGWTPEHLEAPSSVPRRLRALVGRVLRDTLGISNGRRRFV